MNRGREREATDLTQQEKDPLPKLYGLLGTAEGILDGILSPVSLLFRMKGASELQGGAMGCGTGFD